MTAPLPEMVRIFGVECHHGGRGLYSCTDTELRMTVGLGDFDGKWWWVEVTGEGGWAINGPVGNSPELAVAALHDLVRKLAGEIR